MKLNPRTIVFCALILASGATAAVGPLLAADRRSDSGEIRLVLPVIDPAKGSALFVSRGCVLCHSVNGVGGQAGPPLDALSEQAALDPFEFAARMWRGAFAMIELQGLKLGYQLDILGEDLAHIAGFLHDPRAQARFRESDVPELIRDLFIMEPYELGTGLVDPRR